MTEINFLEIYKKLNEEGLYPRAIGDIPNVTLISPRGESKKVSLLKIVNKINRLKNGLSVMEIAFEENSNKILLISTKMLKSSIVSTFEQNLNFYEL